MAPLYLALPNALASGDPLPDAQRTQVLAENDQVAKLMVQHDCGEIPVIDTAEHPIGVLARLRFRVTVNTDNRLMSGVTLSSELVALSDAFGYGWDDLEWFTLNAMKSSFWPFDQRLRIINEQIKPGYAMLKAASLGSSIGAIAGR